MTTSKTRKTPTPEATLQTQEEHFTFGVTVEQIDQFHTLLRTITAQSDMVAVCQRQAAGRQQSVSPGREHLQCRPRGARCGR